jgi:hypothetical protein
MSQVLDFEPQNRVADVRAAVERLAVKTHGAVALAPLDESAWASFLLARESSIARVYSPAALGEEQQGQAVTWFQSGALIAVTIALPRSEIAATDAEVRCAALAGAWWGPVSGVEVSEAGELTQLALTVDSQWPYLVRGGAPDGLSCYVLALIALELKAPEMAELWLRHGALLGDRLALTSYAVHLFERQDWPQAFHFLCRAVLNFGDDMCGFLLAKLLVESDAPLAECMLCRLCQNGFPRAFYALANLYLDGAPGVEPMPQKAKLLLQIASIRWGDEDAARLLQTCGAKEEPEQGAPAGAPQSATAVDWAIACGIAAGLATLGYFVFRAFARPSK